MGYPLEKIGPNRDKIILNEVIEEYEGKTGTYLRGNNFIISLKTNKLEEVAKYIVFPIMTIFSWGNVDAGYYWEEKLIRYFFRRKIQKIKNL